MANIPISYLSPAASVADIATNQTGDEYENNGTMVVLIFNSSGNPISVKRLVQTQPPAPDICVDNELPCPPGLTILPAVAPRRYNTGLSRVQVRYPDGQAVNLRIAVVSIPAAL